MNINLIRHYDFKILSFLIIVFLSILHISEYDTPISDELQKCFSKLQAILHQLTSDSM